MNPILSHLSQDKILRAVIESLNLPELPDNQDVYKTLLDSIVSQQLSVKAANTIFGRFCQLFPNNYPEPNLLLQTSAETLRSAGLSGQKANYLKNIADFHLHTFPISYENLNTLTDEEIIKTLTVIKGVGKWTVEMLLIFSLKRLDVLPLDDLGIRQGFIKLYGLEQTGKALFPAMNEIAEAWQPYRSVACRYLWLAKDTPKP